MITYALCRGIASGVYVETYWLDLGYLPIEYLTGEDAAPYSSIEFAYL
jgi:hypothetical protein